MLEWLFCLVGLNGHLKECGDIKNRWLPNPTMASGSDQDELLRLYDRILGFGCECSTSEFEKISKQYSLISSNNDPLPEPEIRTRFLGMSAMRFPFGKDVKKSVFDYLFSIGVETNSMEKKLILDLVGSQNWTSVLKCINDKGGDLKTPEQLKQLIQFPTEREIIERITIELANPTKTRKDATNKSAVENIHGALLGLLAWCSFPKESIDSTFLHSDKYDYINSVNPERFSRSRACVTIRINQALVDQLQNYEQVRDSCCALIKREYGSMSNHSYITIVVEPIRIESEYLQAQLVADITLFSEKFVSTELKAGYFRPANIRQTTESYIPNLESELTQFNSAFHGFEFRDAFVLAEYGHSSVQSTVCIIFELNRVDENVILVQSVGRLSTYEATHIQSLE